MFYAHNIVRKLRAYIFVQSLLKGFLDWTGTESGYDWGDDDDRYSAKELSELIKKQLQDKEGLAIDEVEIITDKSKAEIIQKFRDIKDES